MPLTIALFNQQIRTTLGGGSTGVGIEVELDDVDLLLVLRQAIRVYNRNLPKRNRARLPTVNSQQRYVLTQPGLLGVTAVSFVNTTQESNVSPFDPLLQSVLGHNSGGTNTVIGATDFTAYTMALQDGQYAFSSNPDWHYEVEGDEKCLYVDIPDTAGATYSVGYEYVWGLTPDDNATTGLSKLPADDEDWVLNYGLALSKEILARRRGKFGGISSPDDGSTEVDAQALLAEALDGNRGLTEMETELKNRRPPLLPDIG